MGHLKKNWAKKERKKSEKRAHSLSKSDDQERTQILKIGVKEWAKSIFLEVSEIWAKLTKKMSVEHVADLVNVNFA